jgi:LysM repeat protein
LSRQIKSVIIGGTAGLVVGAILLGVIGLVTASPGEGDTSEDVTSPAQVPVTLAAEGESGDPLLAPTDTLMPTPTEVPTYHTVEAGDTIWSIAVKYDAPIEAIVQANPGINPDILYPGDVLLIPDPDNPNQVTPTLVEPDTSASVTSSSADTGVTGTVATDGSSLRLRDEPKLLNNVIGHLDPGTRLTIVGRTEDDRWLQVVTPNGEPGWVLRDWVVVSGALESIPVTGESFTVGSDVTPLAPPQVQAAGPYPYISNITDTSRGIFVRGQSLGNRANVFSKVGDSITDNDIFLIPIGLGEYDLREYGELESVIAYYSQAVARDQNSFANTSLAAKGGWSAWHLTDPDTADSELCLPGETPLVCEYRIVRPSVALIMLGTNDIPTAPPRVYEGWMRQTLETSIDMGVIPVLSTIPAFHDEENPKEFVSRVAVFNGIITGLAQEYDIPLWDYWAALQYLPNDGLSNDGIHPSWAVAADFTPANLQYGMPVRNLTALQALDAVWQEVLS